MPEFANNKALVHVDEEALLQGIRSHDPEALARIYDCFSEVVYSVALRILREPSAAEDVLQKVFLQLWRNPDSCGPSSVGAWLALAARNRSVDILRGRRPQENSDDLLPACNMNFADPAVRECLTRKVRQAMVAMPAEQRRVLELAFFEGWTPDEIAQSTGDGLGIIRDCLRSALFFFRHALQDEPVSTVGNALLEREQNTVPSTPQTLRGIMRL